MENKGQSNRNYKPINGDFYDELEAAATLNQTCEITYQDESRQEQHVISKIIDLYIENGVEYAKLENKIIRLDSIVSLNGKTEGGGKVDTNRLQEDMVHDDTAQFSSQPGQNPLQQHDVLGSPTPGDMHLHQDEALINKDINEGNFVGDVSNLGSTGISADRITTITTSIHQNEKVEENLLGDIPASEEGKNSTSRSNTNAIIIETPSAETIPHASSVPGHVVQKEDESDLAHRFLTSPPPFLIAENQYYHLSADRLSNRLYLKVLHEWSSPAAVPEMGGYLEKIAPLMPTPFTLLNDLTDLKPDESGTLLSPAIPNKDALISAGLMKVADLVPYDCETLVHGIHSFSVNSLRLRYFKDKLQAEHWLTGDAQIGGDMKEGRGSMYN